MKLGKLQIKGTIPSIIDDLINNNFEILPINFAHVTKNFDLDFHHRDPFDRMIISQAIVEGMLIISKDGQFDNYLKEPLKRYW